MRFFTRSHSNDWEQIVGHRAYEKSETAILVLTEKEIVACNDAAVRLLRCRGKAEVLARHPGELSPEFQPNGQRSVRSCQRKGRQRPAGGTRALRLESPARRRQPVPGGGDPGSGGNRRPTPHYLLLAGHRGAGRGTRGEATRHGATRRRLRGERRRHRRHGIFGRRRNAGNGIVHECHGQGDLAAVGRRRHRLGASLGQRAGGGLHRGGARQFGRRDQPPGQRLLDHRRQGGRRVRAHQRHGQRPRRRRAEDRRRRDQPDQRHRQPDQPAGAQRHHRGGARRRGRQGLRGGGVARSRAWPTRPPRRPRRSAPRSPRCRAATGDTVAAIQAIGATIGEINEIATAIASAVEQQGAATQEIARNVQQAAAGTSEVAEQHRRRQPGRRRDRRGGGAGALRRARTVPAGGSKCYAAESISSWPPSGPPDATRLRQAAGRPWSDHVISVAGCAIVRRRGRLLPLRRRSAELGREHLRRRDELILRRDRQDLPRAHLRCLPQQTIDRGTSGLQRRHRAPGPQPMEQKKCRDRISRPVDTHPQPSVRSK